jgi:hypothetical protein
MQCERTIRGEKHGLALSVLVGLLILSGCRSSASRSATTRPASTQTTDGLDRQRIDALDAICAVPAGWKPDPMKHSDSFDHEVWISPTKRTAYGVIRFHLPWPVGHELALWGFLVEMRASEGEAKLISKHWDQNLRGLRFVAGGGRYNVRANLFAHGFTGWTVFAGSLTKFTVDEEELKQAELARENTVVDLD